MPPVEPLLLLIDGTPEAEALQVGLNGLGFRCDWAKTGPEGAERVRDGRYEAVISEFRLEGLGGLKVLHEIRALRPRLPVILLSGHGGSDTAIEAIKAGAYDWLLKPADLEEVREVLTKAVTDARRMSKPVEIGEVYPEQDTIVGRSRAMREIYKQLGRVAAQPVNVLIRGDTGTGKELIARAIYQHGHRAHRPFIAVNCAAIPENLLESELFGHEKGSFTGADRQRIGRFEQAHGGTLFLDEIGDLDATLQSKLLRVLQEKVIQRVGGQQEIPVDVRVIAATHRNLEAMIARGDFREDLFYRLNVVCITIPPLRERREDIAALVDYFLERYGREYGIESPSIAAKAVEFLSSQDWPGNIRQLQNVIRKALLASRGYTIGWQDCRQVLENSEPAGREEDPSLSSLVNQTLTRVINGETGEALPVLQAAFEKEVYGQTIQRSGGNQAKAARWLGVSRLTLREKLRQYGLHPKENG